MSLYIESLHLHRIDLKTRMPFRYGIASVTDLPHVFLQVSARVAGNPVTGFAADHLAPKWFTKNPESLPEEDIAEMLAVIHHAMELAEGREADTPFDLWHTLYAEQMAWANAHKIAPLLAHFGVTLIERAVIEAWCRAHEEPFATLLQTNRLGIRLEAVYAELSGTTPADWLPKTPLLRVVARHTVGLADPLREADLSPDERLNDGLPETLESAIRTYGLRHFKLKIGGNPVADSARVLAILQTVQESCGTDWAYTLDGNESCKTLSDLREFWECLTAGTTGEIAKKHLLFIEQPLHRRDALSAETGEGFLAWENHPPILIDESDGAIGDFPQALSLGYAGTSHKNCKGVFKGVANACFAQKRGAVLSGEDLTNIGPIALLQDLAVQSALGIASVERNGHHYFRGLSAFAYSLQKQIVENHPDLYQWTPSGFATLRIADGTIALDSVHRAAFGYTLTPEALFPTNGITEPALVI
jgi:L-alanine-DL-glutamate epimerase-like enolase superfamily enzyme